MTAPLDIDSARLTYAPRLSSSLRWRMVWILAAAISVSCSSSLDSSVEDKSCSTSGQCLPGYVCSNEWVCVHKSQAAAPVRGSDAAPEENADATADRDASEGDGASSLGTAAAVPGSDAAVCQDGIPCGDQCVDPMHNAKHCGACNQRCETTPNGRAVCTDGACGTACDQGFTLCDGGCHQLSSDPQHCGGCGSSCPLLANGSVSCVDGRCLPTCNADFTDCSGECVRLAIDPRHCGACGIVCAADQQCAGGTCVRACPPGTQPCDQSCVDPTIDIQHCGACGNACAAPTGGSSTCSNSACSEQCPDGLTACGGACVDTQSEIMNCGGCGNVCSATAARSHATCYEGECGTACDFGYLPCDEYCVAIALLRDQRAFTLCALLAASPDN